MWLFVSTAPGNKDCGWIIECLVRFKILNTCCILWSNQSISSTFERFDFGVKGAKFQSKISDQKCFILASISNVRLCTCSSISKFQTMTNSSRCDVFLLSHRFSIKSINQLQSATWSWDYGSGGVRQLGSASNLYPFDAVQHTKPSLSQYLSIIRKIHLKCQK